MKEAEKRAHAQRQKSLSFLKAQLEKQIAEEAHMAAAEMFAEGSRIAVSALNKQTE